MKVDIKFPSTLSDKASDVISNVIVLAVQSKLICSGNGLVMEQQGDAVSFFQVVKAVQPLEDAE
ncbi:hypothetical protein MUK42_35612, partial [Musa troglodytarum]